MGDSRPSFSITARRRNSTARAQIDSSSEIDLFDVAVANKHTSFRSLWVSVAIDSRIRRLSASCCRWLLSMASAS